ncbi:DUF4350 domain-containing protein [Microbacterium sp. CFBP9034]|uniref:DUF4350 domain-containing protein n=1 Tax=Microbacterium sp. CFBP9034 TaxID=3096540 RepID=UPI002A6A5798|nr:DUF4350 domain-containing protein [Microbacterium sp. CFBP9034]MDY0909029.1 DUF4350 domain-containing protein [Microbacterium sp. CFBP9034]
MSADTAVVTAPPMSRRRRIGAWIAIGVALLVIGGIGAAMTIAGEWTPRDALDPESAGPAGTRALVEILREHGVEVRVVRSHGDAAAALAGGTETLVVADTPALSDDGLLALTDLAADVVLIDPRARTLDLLIPGAEPAGSAPAGLVDPDCALDAARRSGAIQPGTIFRPSGNSSLSSCYPVGDAHALLVGEHGYGSVAAVDGTALFTNEQLAEDGNASLGVNLMGQHPLVVWYQPGLGDTDLTDTDPTIGELTPPWVSPVIVLLLVAGVAAGIWRGRRFGPLVAERLPVTVRASETTEGRARLYAQSRDVLHAADQLRIGAIERIGRVLGLGPAASAPDVSDAAAARAGLDRSATRGVLIDHIPADEADLVALSLQLRHLEDAVHAAVRPERNPR